MITTRINAEDVQVGDLVVVDGGEREVAHIRAVGLLLRLIEFSFRDGGKVTMDDTDLIKVRLD